MKDTGRGDIVFSNEKMLEHKEQAMRKKQIFPMAFQNYDKPLPVREFEKRLEQNTYPDKD